MVRVYGIYSITENGVETYENFNANSIEEAIEQWRSKDSGTITRIDFIGFIKHGVLYKVSNLK